MSAFIHFGIVVVPELTAARLSICADVFDD
jgi:hypothetical protein